MKPKFHAALANDGALELCIYGDLVDAATIASLEAWGYSTDGFVSSVSVKKALDTGGSFSKVRLRINSPGGDAFEGMAIHSLLQSCGKPVEAYVDGLAASAASIIAMAAGTRIMGRTAMMMIHNAWAGCVGNKNDMTKMAAALDSIDESIASAYVDRTKMTLAQVKSLMDDESWFSADDCIKNGLATAIVAPPAEEEQSAAAMAKTFKALAKLKHVPEQFKAQVEAPPPAVPTPAATAPHVRNTACACDCENCENSDCANCTNKDCDDSNCKDCPMQAEAGNRAREEINMAAAGMKAKQRRAER